MIYYTGDIHGDPKYIERFCGRIKPDPGDTIVILGDVGVNYCGEYSLEDFMAKTRLNDLGVTILCIHGNHEMRPSNLKCYDLTEWNGGMVWRDCAHPNLLFARDGDIFTIEGIRHLVIGGAYSVDKYYRLEDGDNWWPDEQPSDEIKRYVEERASENEFDVVLSHTCPYKYRPTENMLRSIDQSTVDTSTEEWLDEIEEKIDYRAWFCGHWHTNRRIDRMHFLYHDFESSDMF